MSTFVKNAIITAWEFFQGICDIYFKGSWTNAAINPLHSKHFSSQIDHLLDCGFSFSFVELKLNLMDYEGT